MSGLPKGWAKAKLKEVTIKCAQNKPESEEELTYVDIGSINRSLKVIENPQYLKGADAPNRARKRINTNDVLVSLTRPNLNAVAHVTKDYDEQYASTGFEVIKPVKVDSRYIFALVKTQDFISSISGVVQGALYPAAKSSDVQNYEFPLPPLNEQIRIADKLDSILAKVDAAQARLDKIPNILKRFRQSVLAAATSGDLTKEWRDEDDVIKSVASTWEIKNLPINWQVKLLPELGTSRLGKMLDKNKNIGINTQYLGNINVRWNSFDLDDLKEIKVSEKEVKDLSIENGDLIICEGGVPGRGAIWKGGKNNLVFQKALHRIRFEELIIPEFALYCIEDDYNSSRLSSLYTGTTIKHLTGKALKSYPLRVPPIEEQKEIIRRVDSLLSMVDTVEKKYNDTRTKTNRLTQSVLTTAFRGELVSQDESDEPAEVLLAKIKAISDALVSNKKAKSKTNKKTKAA